MQHIKMEAEKSVMVAVRSRPLLQRYDETFNPNLVFAQNEVTLQDKGYTFDYVFPPDSTNVHVYNTAVGNRLPKIFEGYNLTIFAYGQTGSGKTYTMGTNYPSVSQNESGIIFLSVTRLFEDIKQKQTDYEFTVNVSFLEVYKEDVYDLLSKERKSCQIREDFDGVKVVNLTEAPVTSVDEVLKVLEQGCRCRFTASTAMNAHSSRSHSLFILSIEQRSKLECDTKKSKFQLIDLAGSERADQSKTEGLRFKEGIDINRGLLALGKVISALSDGKSHIPYRDSRLTRLLMDSLGGNSFTIMIACISPSLSNTDETLSTLRYASRARKIRNKPIVNNDPPEIQIQKLKEQVKLLQAQMYKRSFSMENISGIEEHSEFKEQNKSLKDQIQRYISRIATLNEKLNKGEASLGLMKQKIKTLHEQLQETFYCFNDNNNNKMLEEDRSYMCLSMKGRKSIMDRFYINKYEVNESLSASDIVLDLKAIEQDLNELMVAESQIALHVINKNSSECEDRFASEDVNISSGSDTSDGDNSDLEIADIGRKLEKVELQLMQKQEIAEHFEVLSEAIDQSSTDNLNSLQEKVDVLMKEKNELEIALKNSEKMLSEERNKRYKECQSEIKSLEKEILRTKFLKKIKEENKAKIDNLQREIQNLKTMKVKLLKKMKSENDNFRKMQIAKDREVEKLKKNERKKDFEILKMRNNFDKKVNAFKLKIEKYQSLNKRLNEALCKQKTSQLVLKDKKIPKPNMEMWLMKEIEVEALKRMASSEYIAAKENMGHLTLEAHNMKTASTEANIENKSCSLVLLNLEVENFNQHKPIQSESLDEKNVDRWKTLNSMIDAKTALAVLFDKCVEDYVKLNTDVGTSTPTKEQDCESNVKQQEDERMNLLAQIKSLKDKISFMKRDYEKKLREGECEQSKKVIQCLKNMNELKKSVMENQSDIRVSEEIQKQFHFQESEIAKLQQKLEDYNSLKEEAARWKEECMKMKMAKKRKLMGDFNQRSSLSLQDVNKNSMLREYLEEDPIDDSFQSTDDPNDPDWRMTPMYKRKRTTFRMKDFTGKSVEAGDSEMCLSRKSEKEDDDSGFSVQSIKEVQPLNLKRKSEEPDNFEMPSKRSFSGCKCNGKCGTKKCICKKHDKECDASCSCNRDMCVNISVEEEP